MKTQCTNSPRSNISLKFRRLAPKALASLIAYVAFSLFSAASEAADPHIQWQKIETEHFEILFDSRHYQLAKDFARHGETAWKTLVPVLRTWPDKTVVVIDDSGDQANGMATGFPYPQIHLFPATPAPGDTIGDTGPWGLELIMHEYTHVLNFQPAHGVFHTLRNIFGSIVRPNLLLPRWYLEGLAVEMETRFSPSGGRLRSPDFMAIPRAMVQDNILRREDVARIGETNIPDWPGGSRPYLLGGLVWEKLARENLSIVGDLNDAYAKRLPFFIDGPLEDRRGMGWQGYLESVYDDVEKRSTGQIEEICENGCVEGKKLGENSFYTRSPVLSRTFDANGAAKSLAFITREHNHDSVIEILDRSESGAFDVSKVIRAAEPTGASRLTWTPDAKALIYDGIDDFGRFESRSDLWSYDRVSLKTTRLSRGLRAREPDVNRSGEKIVFVQLTPGHSQISIADFSRSADGTFVLSPAKVLYSPVGETRVSWPTFVGKDFVIFVERNADGKEVLKVVDPVSGATRTVDTGGSATFPRVVMDPKSRSRLLFASNRSGITNLYMADISRESSYRDLAVTNVKPITNSVTRAWVGDYDVVTENLIYSRLDGDGSRLRISTTGDRSLNQSLRDEKLPKIPLLIERPEPKYVLEEATLPAAQLDKHDFNVWPYLVPRYWMPYAAFVPGGAFLSASTSAGDPMGRHALSASISTDTRVGKPNFFAAYSNSTTDVRYTILGDDYWQRLSGLDRRSTMADLSGSFFVTGLSNNWKGEAGLSRERSEIPLSSGGTDVQTKSGPRLGLLWQSLSQKGYEVSPEKGGYFRISHARYMAELGNLVYDKTDINGTKYFSKVSNPTVLGWLPDRHAMNLSAGISWLPGLDRLLLAPSSVSLPVETIALGSSSTSFVMRGYPSGALLARKLLRSSFEYRLPLSVSYHGFGTTPALIRRWHAVVFADLVTLEGAFYDFGGGTYRRSELGNMFGSAGVEARLDSTLFYHLPVQFIFGVHMGFDKRVNPNGAYPTISISL
jgi:hypothetical protein